MSRAHRIAVALACLAACGGGDPIDLGVVDASSPPDAGQGAVIPPRPIQLTTFLDGAQANLPFVAASLDGGAWQVLAGEGGAYDFTAGRFGVVYVCPFTIGKVPASTVIFLYATADDFTAITRGCDTGAVVPATQRVGGVIENVGEGRTADVAMGPGSGRSSVERGYRLAVPLGTWDMAVVRDDGITTDQVIVRRDVAVADTPVVQNFDFAKGMGAVATATAPVTVAGVDPAEAIFLRSFFHLGDGAVLFLLASGLNVNLVPADLLEGSDIHEVEVVLRAGSSVRSAATFAKAPASVDFTLLDPVVAVVSVVSAAPLTLHVTAALDPSATVYAVHYIQTMGSHREVDAVFTAAAVIGSSLEDTTPMAEVAALPGWDPAWELTAGVTTGYSVTLRQSSRPPSFDQDRDPATDPALEGAIGRASSVDGTLVP